MVLLFLLLYDLPKCCGFSLEMSVTSFVHFLLKTSGLDGVPDITRKQPAFRRHVSGNLLCGQNYTALETVCNTL